jgi:hypothetical protein
MMLTAETTKSEYPWYVGAREHQNQTWLTGLELSIELRMGAGGLDIMEALASLSATLHMAL